MTSSKAGQDAHPTARERFLEIKKDGFSPGQNQYDIGFLVALVEAAASTAEHIPIWSGENRITKAWEAIEQRMAEGEEKI